MDSRKLSADTDEYHLINRIVIDTETDEPTGCVDMVVSSEVETVEINEQGQDVGSNSGAGQLYRFPFPENVHLRKEMLRHIKKQVTILMATTPSLYW